MSEHLWRDMSSDSDDGQGWLIVREPPQARAGMISEEEWQRLCVHPQITTLPPSPEYLSGIACVICGKRCIIGYRDVFLNPHEKREDFCLAEKLKATFGDAWEEAAVAETCSCVRCTGKRGLV